MLFVEPYDSRLRINGNTTIGVTDLNDRTICIANDLDDELFYKCLSHELCHATMFSFDLNFDIEDEECICKVVELFGEAISDLAFDIYTNIKGDRV